MSERTAESRIVLPSPFPRDTLVVEATFPDAIGSDERGARKIQRYLHELAEITRFTPLHEPETNLSPLYGFSAWLASRGKRAFHLYAWDEVGKPTWPFASLDISTPGVLENSAEVIAHMGEFFGAAAETIVHKTLRNPEGRNEHTWKELAPHILRQRLAIVGQREAPLQITEIQAYLRDLCRVLEMTQLSEPLVQDDAAWVHWETSGTVASWEKGQFSTDIYTCKEFDPEKAVLYTRNSLHLSGIVSQEF